MFALSSSGRKGGIRVLFFGRGYLVFAFRTHRGGAYSVPYGGGNSVVFLFSHSRVVLSSLNLEPALCCVVGTVRGDALGEQSATRTAVCCVLWAVSISWVERVAATGRSYQ